MRMGYIKERRYRISLLSFTELIGLDRAWCRGLKRIGEIKHVAHDRETRVNAQAQKDEGKTDQKIFGRASILRF